MAVIAGYSFHKRSGRESNPAIGCPARSFVRLHHQSVSSSHYWLSGCEPVFRTPDQLHRLSPPSGFTINLPIVCRSLPAVTTMGFRLHVYWRSQVTRRSVAVIVGSFLRRLSPVDHEYASEATSTPLESSSGRLRFRGRQTVRTEIRSDDPQQQPAVPHC